MQDGSLNTADLRARLLEAIKPEVPFDGWSHPAFNAAVAAVGVDAGLARVVCPRGAIDLACDYHRAADRAAEQALRTRNWPDMAFREKIASAVRYRLELVDPELVRRAASAFALPQNAGAGGRLVFEMSDMIWRALGDTSQDGNWYTKRALLAGVISATVLFWMGDESADKADTWAFLDNRIADVMQIERFKGQLMTLPGVKALFGAIRAPGPRSMPGHTAPERSNG